MGAIRKELYWWRWNRRHFDVFDADGQCAGNLRWTQATEYADGRSKLRAYRGKDSIVTIVSRAPYGQHIWKIYGKA